MKKLGFTSWVKDRETLNEFTMKFGQHKGKDHTAVPSGWLDWALKKGIGDPYLSQDNIEDIKKELAKRNNGSQQPVVNQPAIQTPQTTKKKEYVLAIAKGNMGFKPGQKMAIEKLNDGNWSYQTLDGTKKTGILPNSGIADIIQSVKYEFGANKGKTITAPDPILLKSIFNKDRNIPPADPYKIRDNKITEEQRNIEKAFVYGNNPQSSENEKENIVVSALAGTGKAQPMNSLLLGPNGWVKMSGIKTGDKVFGSDGLPHEVTGVFPQGIKDIIEVTFSDGSKTECCKEHLWTTETKRNRDKCRFYKKPLFSYSSTINTQSITETLLYKDHPNHYIPLVSPLVFENLKLNIDPYVIGILLGDGSFRTGSVSYSSENQEIVTSVNATLPTTLVSKRINKCDYRITGNKKGIRNPIVSEIKNLGLWKKLSNEKFIPNSYKFNSIENRISVLQGLLDTDGFTDGTNVEYYTTSKKLAEDVQFLIESLGGTANINIKTPKYIYKGEKKVGKLCYRLNLKIPSWIQPFRLSKKIKAYKIRTKYLPKRSITSVVEVGRKECQCITVASKDNLYVTNNCILTHNTTILKHLASLYKPGQKWLYLVFGKKNQTEAEAKKFHEELGETIRAFPDNIEVLTSHSFLGKVLKDNHAYGKIHPTDLPKTEKGKKYKKITDVMSRDWFVDKATDELGIPTWLLKPYTSAAKNLVEKAKNYALNPDNPNIQTELEKLITSYDIDTKLIPVDKRTGMEKDYKPEIIQGAVEVMHQTMPGKADPSWMTKQGEPLRSIRDQDDTLWYAAIHADDLVWPHYDVVMADEIQDFNKAQVIMLQKLHEAGARIVAVGDENQSLFRFRGADSQSFNNVAAMLGTAINGKTQKPRGVIRPNLSVNFRSGSHIIDYVNKNTHVNNLKSGRPDIDKEVQEEMGKEDKTLQDAVSEDKGYHEVIDGLINEWQQNGQLKRPTALLARTNKPLIHAAMYLMKNKVPFEIVGNDFQEDLIRFVDEVVKKFGPKQPYVKGTWKPKVKMSLKDFDNYMNNWVQTTENEWNKLSDKDKAKNHQKEVALHELKETAQALNSVLQELAANNWIEPESGRPVANTEDFKEYLNYVFKGRNEDNAKNELQGRDPKSYVTITTAHKAKGLEWERVYIIRDDLFPHPAAKNAEDLKQEENAKYVAYTRATHELHVLKDGEPGGKKKKY